MLRLRHIGRGMNRLGRGYKPVASTATPITYLLRDDFTTARAAGATNDTAPEPGGGGNRIVADTNSKLSISGKVAEFATGGAAAGNPGLWWTNSYARTYGRVVVAKFTPFGSGNTLGAGWDNNTTTVLTEAIRFINTATIAAVANNVAVNVGAYTGLFTYQVAVVQRAAGGFMLVQGGDYPVWTLLWDHKAGTVALFPGAGCISTLSVADLRSVRVPNELFSIIPLAYDTFTRADGVLGSSETTGPDSQVTTARAYTSVLGTWAITSNAAGASALSGGLAIAVIDVGVADVHHSVNLTRSASTVSIIARYVDVSNYVYAQLLNDGADKVTLRKVVAGVDSEVLAPTAVTYAAAAPLRIFARGVKFRIFYNKLAVGSSQTISDATLQTGTSVGLRTADTSNVFDGLETYAAGTELQYSRLNDYLAGTDYNGLLCLGDSKTDADEWVRLLVQSLRVVTDLPWQEYPLRIAVGGYTVFDLRDYLAANRSLSQGYLVQQICLNIGVNGIGQVLVEADFKAAYRTILDMLIADHPGANIYCARIWRSDFPAEVITVNSWINAIIAEYAAALPGIDESVWLENGDNGATYSVDGVHYNAAGEIVAAAQWKTAMGY